MNERSFERGISPPYLFNTNLPQTAKVFRCAVRGERFLLNPFGTTHYFRQWQPPRRQALPAEPRPGRRELSKPVLKN